MNLQQTSALQEFIHAFMSRFPELSEYAEKVELALSNDDVDLLVDVYHQVYPYVEKALWSDQCFDKNLNYYHAMFREQEGLFRFNHPDNRFQFILSISVAGQPHQVKNCLDSIYQVCVIYAFGGRTDGIFNRIQVVLVDDSRQQENVLALQELADTFTEKGLRVHYYGQSEQLRLMQGIPPSILEKLGMIVTPQDTDEHHHRGATATRNLSYLKCLQLTEDKDRTLYYFIDSDQLFRVNRQSEQGDHSVAGLNYFYYINHIFSSTRVNMMTANLVGNPPCSPAVMASDFLDDVIAVLQNMSEIDEQAPCGFNQSFANHCSIATAHDKRDCLFDYSSKLQDYFLGYQPSQKKTFLYNEEFTSVTPTTTLNLGNYVVNYEGLKYMIPFAHLRLSMSGATAGRLIQAEIDERLVSANLPMLHNRCLNNVEDGESRPEVNELNSVLDLSDEIERQFFGELMFFTVEEITGHSDFNGTIELDFVNQALDKTESKLLAQYKIKQQQTLQKMVQLEAIINDKDHWWHNHAEAQEAVDKCRHFIENLRQNFSHDAKAYLLINSPAHRAQRKQQIGQALLQYGESRQAWEMLFN